MHDQFWPDTKLQYCLSSKYFVTKTERMSNIVTQKDLFSYAEQVRATRIQKCKLKKPMAYPFLELLGSIKY